MAKPISTNFDDFSLTTGGPFFNLMVRSGLMKPEFARPVRRATFLALFTWLPMFLLSLLQTPVPDGRTGLPFLWDFTVHVRFLVCVPLLIVAEVAMVGRTGAAVRHFVRSGLIQEKEIGRAHV